MGRLAPFVATLALGLGTALGLGLTLTGCDGDSSSAVIVDNGRLSAGTLRCPDCKDAATLRSYGSFVFLGTDPVLADLLLSGCGFVVSPDPSGMPSGARQVQGCGGGVEFAFFSGDFRAFRVRSGWTGQTDTGYGIGSTLGDVLDAQPGFVQVDDLTYLLDNGDVRAEANFAADRTLSELIVGRGFRR